MPTDDPDDILEITWDDLNAPPPAEPLFPAVDAADAAVAGSRLPWVEVEAVCARDRAPVLVRFQMQQPGVYTCVSAVAPPGPAKSTPGAGAAAMSQVQARFDLSAYPGCPRCGLPGLIQCDRCGSIMCGSALTQTKRGSYVVCPHCGGKGEVSSPTAVTVSGQVGGVKGAKSKGGKPGW
jgi:hypothetical protein